MEKSLVSWKDLFSSVRPRLVGSGNPRIEAMRTLALTSFLSMGFPKPTWEGWRNTDPTLPVRAWKDPDPSTLSLSRDPPKDDLRKALLSKARERYPYLAPLLERSWWIVEGAVILPPERPLREVLGIPFSKVFDGTILGEEKRILERGVGSLVRSTDPFASLNTSFFPDGLALLVRENTILEEPIGVVRVLGRSDEDPSSSRGPTAPSRSFPRVLLVASRGCDLSFAELSLPLGDSLSFSSSVTEVLVREGAVVEHLRWKESEGGVDLDSLGVSLGRNSIYRSLHATLASSQEGALEFGSGFVRNTIRMVAGFDPLASGRDFDEGEDSARGGGEGVEEPGCEGYLQGLFVGSGESLLDNHTTIDHVSPHGTTREVFKGILTDRSKGVFDGLIRVWPKAQKTDSKQTNKNLLLSREALVDSNPRLEIRADDVKCTHGSTTGHIDRDSLFYLRSRGLSEQEATNLLILAFAREVVEGLRNRALVESSRAGVERWVERLL